MHSDSHMENMEWIKHALIKANQAYIKKTQHFIMCCDVYIISYLYNYKLTHTIGKIRS